MERLTKFIVTFCFVGKFPLASGTAGSLAGLLVYLSLSPYPVFCAGFFFIVFVCGLLFAGRAEKIYGKKDPKEVVIDEVAGIFIVYFQMPLHIVFLVSGFFIYRLLDILKPFPANRLERWPGGAGIMLDDFVVAVYTNCLLRGLWFLINRP